MTGEIPRRGEMDVRQRWWGRLMEAVGVALMAALILGGIWVLWPLR